jgi:tetratricopeptide (TPR) repeat protein
VTKKNVVLILTLLCSSAVAIGQNEPADAQKQLDQLKSQVTQLNDRLVKSEASQGDLRDRVASIQGLFYAAFAMITTLSATATILQFFAGKKERSMLQQEIDRRFAMLDSQTKKYEELIGAQVGRDQELLATTTRNINQITTLLNSLDHAFKFSDKAAALEKQLSGLQEDQLRKEKAEDARQREAVRNTNLEAMKICATLDRSNYKTPENQQRIRSFRNKVTATRAESRHGELLNANVSFLLGLDFALRYLFSEAVEELDQAIRIARRYAIDDADAILYPDTDKSRIEIRAWNKKLVNISLFHKGTILYNLGRYRDAEGIFREAILNYDQDDVRSMIYIPESKYLLGEEDFEQVIASFENVARRVEAMTETRSWRESKEDILGQLYVRYGNCYYPSKHKTHYREFGNLMKAEELYGRAYRTNPHSYLTQFSYAQALSQKATKSIPEGERKDARSKARELFGKVLDAVKVKIGETTEAKILIMLYYTVITCCMEGQIERDSINRYITKILEEGGQLASIKGYRIFSPLSKSDLSFGELKKELESLEREISQSSVEHARIGA